MLLAAILLAYFALLWAVATYYSRGKSDNDTFFRGGRQSSWGLVAFGMIGASISGVSFVSVPGYVGSTQMTYLQMCIGFFFGYLVVAFVLLPLYYRLRLTTIYAYLGQRFGRVSHRTGASFFILSKLIGASSRLYITCLILQQFIFDRIGVPYVATVSLLLFLVWLYTRRAGIRALVFTDTLQTFFMISALVAMLGVVAWRMDLSVSEVWQTVNASDYGRIFVFDDWLSRQYFWKQLLSGVFIVIVMTGLDQDMMQKNLTIPRLRDAQKDMCLYGAAFVPVNWLFLTLGVLLYVFAAREGVALPAKSDELLPMLIAQDSFGQTALVLFCLGIVSAAFSSVDSSLTALTTTTCIDLLGMEQQQEASPRAERMRHGVHAVVVALFVVFTVLFYVFNDNSIIDTLYTLASYTYGPLLGLFAFGLFTRRRLRDNQVPWVAVAAPLVCYGLSLWVPRATGYHFGYELLMLNGLLTFVGLWALSVGKGSQNVRL